MQDALLLLMFYGIAVSLLASIAAISTAIVIISGRVDDRLYSAAFACAALSAFSWLLRNVIVDTDDALRRLAGSYAETGETGYLIMLLMLITPTVACWFMITALVTVAVKLVVKVRTKSDQLQEETK